MITITISGPAKSGKSMLVSLIATMLDSMVGVKLQIIDEGDSLSYEMSNQHRIYPIAGVGNLLRKMFDDTSHAITIRTEQTAKE